MKLTDQEVLEKIQEHQVIIISGTTEGRKRIRKLVYEKLGMKRIIWTRGYTSLVFSLSEKERRLTEVYSLHQSEKNKQFEHLQEGVDILQRMKKPVIVDSFTDIQQIIRGEFVRTVGKKTGEHKYQVRDLDWSVYKHMLKNILTKLKKQKKKVILFADERNKWDDDKLVGQQPAIDKLFIYEADLIIQTTDEHNLLIKDKPLGAKKLLEGQRFGASSKIEVKGVKKGDKIITTMSDVRVVE